ncbi:unannotated protein [freshwater metagenome]|uniref:Unannotated protein n=1 Tax=freshwater metagenome TaxID=449393 RepID=A0A6J7KK89_9ZZZZ
MIGTSSYSPRVLGSDINFSASSIVIVSSDIVERSDAVFGFGASFFLRGFLSSPVFLSTTISGSGKTSVT